ncbi:MAG: DUF2339 domain-containing protein [Saprospiraceae bacterium]|nr:DUF2339 domain-containing protein [Saprospiraceae bacterium]
MTDKEQLARLQQQMDALLQKQGLLHGEILRLKAELARFQQVKSEEEHSATPVPPPVQEIPQAPVPPSKPLAPVSPEPEAARFDWEQYIGGNLVNKIGIAVLLLGLGLFVKYAIDRGFFPPAVRVFSGYLAGLALVGTAFYLRKRFEAYSAVLFSGGMATLYFTSYIGSTFFQPPIIGLFLAFWLMGLLTAATIIVASKYEYQVIGLLGLVGAYAVPFLVNTGSENFVLFFSYVTFINVGVLAVSARRDWRTMIYTACMVTWLIFVISLFTQYDKLSSSPTTWIFAIINVSLFYGAILAWHWRRETPLRAGAYIVLIVQALVFYCIIIALTVGSFKGDNAGLATLLCATPHFLAAYAVQQRFKDRQPSIIFAAIGVFFVTISIPIEFEYEAILLLWMAEVLVLVFASRKIQSNVFEAMAYLLLSILCVVLLYYWANTYYSDQLEPFAPLLNLAFMTNMLLFGGMVGLYFLHQKFPLPNEETLLNKVLKSLPAVMLYLIFYHEIYHSFELEAAQPSGMLGQIGSVQIFRNLVLFIYTFGALALVAAVNSRRWKSTNLNWFIAWAGLMGILLFLATHLVALDELRRIFITDKANSTVWFILIRYLCFGAIGYLYWHIHKILRAMEAIEPYRPQVPLLFHLLLLVILSSELVTVMLLMMGKPSSPLPYREGFSILWGLYSFLLIGLGFKQKTQTLRVAGMVLFAITLVKIFFFDLANLPILSRTGLFLALGLLLLGASYMYQRFRERL